MCYYGETQLKYKSLNVVNIYTVFTIFRVTLLRSVNKGPNLFDKIKQGNNKLILICRLLIKIRTSFLAANSKTFEIINVVNHSSNMITKLQK